MGRIELIIYDAVTKEQKACVNKWKFQDTVMGEQFITCTITSETPIDWEIGDHCEFRGEIYTLNYIPSVTQKAPIDSVQDAFTYENVKLDSFQDELTRCMMLDVTPTTGDYIAALGTNHTGSSRFQLYCGETEVEISGEFVTLTAVCALAAKMQANLDRLYPTSGWKIYVDTTTTYTTASGDTLLVTHTDSKLLTFDNTTVAQALGMVHTEFKLDYCIRGRNIYIGFSIGSIDPQNPISDLTADDAADQFYFGYGKGYPGIDNEGKGLFQIKQISNNQQKIITRLRALGSTKNLPYNYYFKKYGFTQEVSPGNFTQALFPVNLQLPGTFLPLGQVSDAADLNGSTKWAQNNARSQYLRKVLGDTNDAYIDKSDNAASCPEGIREDCARWDGSNGDLPEIYPTIEGVTFGELREAGVPDQIGATGSTAYQGTTIHPDNERIDNLLAIGYVDNGILVDDANVGDGVMPESEVVDTGTHFSIGIGQTRLSYNAQSGSGDFEETSLYLEGGEQTLFTVRDVSPGNYFMVPTGPSYSSVAYRFSISAQSSASVDVGFVIRVKQFVNGSYTTIATWYSSFITANTVTGEKEMFLPELPDQATTAQVSEIAVTELCDVVVTFAPLIENVNASGQVMLTYQVGRSTSGEYDPEYTWSAVQGDTASKYPFHVFIKDMGFDLTATFNGETPIMAMKSGACVGREFQIGENVQRASVNGVRGYLLTLNRVEDSDLHTYYPNEYYPLAAGDFFVLLNINMPDAYIRAAELRLLIAATDYLADNCETKFTYQPFIDDIYLQRNIDAMAEAGTPEKSIFWRLYAGLKFRFSGIPANASDPLPYIDMTIEQVTITMGEGLTPKVEMVLNDDVQQTTLQRLTIAVDRIYNGSLFAEGSGSAGVSAEAVKRLFLSKINDDIANGRITFADVATFNSLLRATDGINIGDYLSGFLGSGASIGSDGKAEFEEVNVRGALRAAELVFNMVSAEEGESIRSIGHGEIESVTINSSNRNKGTATLKLDGDEWASIAEGDICRGVYNTLGDAGLYDNNNTDTEDDNGFRAKKGFFSSYFRILSVTSKKGECTFTYQLQVQGKTASQTSVSSNTAVTEHPCPLMKFAVYGNCHKTGNAYDMPERQSSIYTTSVGIAPRRLFLAGVDDWKIKPENIKLALGNIDGIKVWQEVTEAEYEQIQDEDERQELEREVDGEVETYWIALKPLYGNAGLYCENNVYLGGIIDQFKSAAMDAINASISNLGQAWIDVRPDRYVVDCDEDGFILDQHSFTITASLYFGNQKCELSTGIGDCYISGYGGVSRYFTDNYTIARDIVIDDFSNPLSSETLTVFLTGTYNGNTYTASKTFTLVANRQGATGSPGQPGQPGANGEGAVSIESNEQIAVVECDSNGVVIANTPVGLSASLKVGDALTQLNTATGVCVFNYGGMQYVPSFSSVDGISNALASKTVTIRRNTTPLSYITILLQGTLNGNTYSATKKVYILANKQGAQGEPGGAGTRGDFKAIAFIRTNTDISSTTPTGGDYEHPWPNGGWSDGIPNGEEKLWACVCTFHGDNTSSGWSAPKPMTDTATYDIEFSPNETQPNDPSDVDSERTAQGWYDPDRNANDSIDWTTMIWRAEREKKNGVWGNWVVAKIKGEKGDTIVGDPGRGIVSIVTWYKRCIEFSNVLPPNRDEDPASSGWVDSYISPSEDEPYLWRFTRTTYTSNPTVEQTDAELVGKFSGTPNYNLLDDTVFLDDNHMGSWVSFWYNGSASQKWSNSERSGDTEYKSRISTDNNCTNFRFGIDSSDKCDGRNSYRANVTASSSLSASGYAIILRQIVFKSGIAERINAGEWYTLSFWHRGDAIRIYTNVLPTGINTVYIDGVATTLDANTNQVSFVASEQWVRHSLTLQVRPSFSSSATYQFDWRLPLVSNTQKSARIAMPKLEVGKMVTEFMASVPEQQPLPLRVVWSVGEQFFSGEVGERYFHLVSDDNRWYRCLRSHISTAENRPNPANDTVYWQRAGNIPFLATGLILGDEGVISLLFSQKILMTNKEGQLTASINDDEKGSYCIYYPETGRKQFEMSSTRQIIAYNDNEGNTLAWWLGNDGVIHKAAGPSWSTIKLYSFGVNKPQNDSFYGNSRFLRTGYPVYIAGATGGGGNQEENGKVYAANHNTMLGPTGNYIDDGWYTEEPNPIQMMSTMHDEDMWELEIIHIRLGVIESKEYITTVRPTEP